MGRGRDLGETKRRKEKGGKVRHYLNQHVTLQSKRPISSVVGRIYSYYVSTFLYNLFAHPSFYNTQHSVRPTLSQRPTLPGLSASRPAPPRPLLTGTRPAPSMPSTSKPDNAHLKQCAKPQGLSDAAIPERKESLQSPPSDDRDRERSRERELPATHQVTSNAATVPNGHPPVKPLQTAEPTQPGGIAAVVDGDRSKTPGSGNVAAVAAALEKPKPKEVEKRINTMTEAQILEKACKKLQEF
ncbi:hypothetical protein F5888DRAFT_1886483 [Russula emetica]|nr:hypothetical protein F5888DRAFT_1886483 [Russula emetica]